MDGWIEEYHKCVYNCYILVGLLYYTSLGYSNIQYIGFFGASLFAGADTNLQGRSPSHLLLHDYSSALLNPDVVNYTCTHRV